MKRIVITSLHFSPAFIGHMEAWYELCSACGLKPALFIDKEYVKYFKGSKYKFTTRLSQIQKFSPNFAVVQNNGLENIEFFKWCTKNNCKILYVVHEPYMGFKELMKDGDYWWKQFAACVLNNWLCGKSTKVILCSDYAEQNCKRYMKKAYEKAVRMPLLFLDGDVSKSDEDRKYCSLIGTYSYPKGSDLFLKFIKDSLDKGYDISFQIATRSDLKEELKDDAFQKLIKEGKLLVQEGRTLTTDEMNQAYKRSICTWNGYRRTTQSGVLPNAFMMGTRVLASSIGSFREFVKPGVTGEFIDPESTDSIYRAYLKIKENADQYSEGCRKEFLGNNYYASQVDTFKKLIESIS